MPIRTTINERTLRRTLPQRGRSGTSSVEHLPVNAGVATLFRYGRRFA